MSCEQFIENVSELLRSLNEDIDDDSRSPATSPEIQKYYVISDVIHRYIVPAICIFGVAGNLLNLIILTRKRLQRRYGLSFRVADWMQVSAANALDKSEYLSTYWIGKRYR